MVTWFAQTLRDTCWSAHLLVQTTTDQAAPLITRLDPPSRTKVIMALVALTLVGLSLLSLIVVLGRRARRLARKNLGKTRTGHDDWFRKPLVRDDSEEPSAGNP